MRGNGVEGHGVTQSQIYPKGEPESWDPFSWASQGPAYGSGATAVLCHAPVHKADGTTVQGGVGALEGEP